jgi:hypothetical protein
MTITRAVRTDLVIETSTSFRHEFRRATVNGKKALRDLVVGDLVWHEGDAWPVRDVRSAHPGKVVVELGEGLYTDPTIVADRDRLIETVGYGTPITAIAAFVPQGVDPPTTWELPTLIDGDKAVVELTVADTVALAARIDGVAEASWGPSGFACPWDLVVEYTDATVRLAQGTLVVVRSAATAAVPIPISTTP